MSRTLQSSRSLGCHTAVKTKVDMDLPKTKTRLAYLISREKIPSIFAGASLQPQTLREDLQCSEASATHFRIPAIGEPISNLHLSIPTLLHDNCVPMASTDDIHLTDYNQDRTRYDTELRLNSIHSHVSSTGDGEHEQMALPRADGGRHAFLFLAGSFMIEALLWGRPSIRQTLSQLVTRTL